jgi:ATP-dependent DNA ligase
VERLDLEGIVAKRKADPYAATTQWLKVKDRAYTQVEGRGEYSIPSQADTTRYVTVPWRLEVVGSAP